jgi:polysaccharide biosynthesis protein PslH
VARSTSYLLVATNLPHPPRGGVDLRNWQNADALAALGSTAVIGLRGGESPPPDSRIAHWSSLGTPADEGRPALTWLRDPLGHPADGWTSEAVLEELVPLVERLEPGVVVLEQLWLHRFIGPLRALGCAVVLDAHNLEGPLHAELAEGRDDPLSAKLGERAALIEKTAFAAADQVWVCSDRDAALAREIYGVEAAVVPNTIDVERYDFRDQDRPPATVVYAGTFSYPPNMTAAQRLVQSIFPAFASQVDEPRMTLVGSRPTRGMHEAARRDPRIAVTGAVEDTAPYLLDATVTAIPLLEGGGTRFKVLEALATGLPVVSTAKGVEGLGLVPGEHYLNAEADAEFADTLASVCSDPDLRSELARRGLDAVRDGYSFAVSRSRVAAALAA